MRALYKESKKDPGHLCLKSALQVLEKNPNLLEINSHVVQKQLRKLNMSFYIVDHLKAKIAKITKYYLKPKDM